MRFMVMVKSTPADEGRMPTEQELAAMGAYNEELVKAGVMLGGEGLHDTSKAAKVTFTAGKPTVIDGPFTEAKELVAGFWVFEAKSREEAIEWVKRIPCTDEEFTVEIRQAVEAEDFDEAYTPELRELEKSQEQRLRERSAEQR